MSSLTEENIKKWALSLEDLMNDPTGLQEFMSYLEKEYSLENIKFWLAVNNFKKCTESEIIRNSTDIYNEFLAPGAFYEINIDGKTKENILKNMENPSIIMFDDAADHVYMLLLKKDSYPRFIRSEHYKYLLANGVQHLAKRRGLCGCNSKNYCEERMKGIPCSCALYSSKSVLNTNQLTPGGSATKKTISSRTSSPLDFFFNIETFSHSRSQSNISERGYLSGAEDRVSTGGIVTTPAERSMVDDVCPWDAPEYKDIKMPTRDLLMAYNLSGSGGRGRSRSAAGRFSWRSCIGGCGKRRGEPKSPTIMLKNPVSETSLVDSVDKTPSPSTSAGRVLKSSSPAVESYRMKTFPSVKCDLQQLADATASNPTASSSTKVCCDPSTSTNYYDPQSPSTSGSHKLKSFFKCNPTPTASSETCDPKSLLFSSSPSKQLSSEIKKLNAKKLFASATKRLVTPTINITSSDSKSSVSKGAAAAAMAVAVGGVVGGAGEGSSETEGEDGGFVLLSKSKAWFSSQTVKVVRKNISRAINTKPRDA